ncbi:MAG: hypothetical protein ACHQK9_07165 [Reyranellales bacterium]
MRARSLLWLIALLAFVCPPTFGVLAGPAAHAATMASADCPDHMPPPKPCPAQGTARHAAGSCCPMMTGAVALLPSVPAAEPRHPAHASIRSTVAGLSGLLFAKDPPPPRA